MVVHTPIWVNGYGVCCKPAEPTLETSLAPLFGRSLGSTLAIRPHNKPRRLVVAQMPVGLLLCQYPWVTRKSRTSPQLLAHQGERISEGWMALVVPGRLTKDARCLPHPAMREQSDQR